MKNRRNYYRILQVQPDAPTEIIRASYRTLMREMKLHPDLGGSTAEASLLNEAYETLSDPKRRAAYDEKMRTKGFRRAESHTGPPTSPSRKPKLVSCPFCRKPVTPEAQAAHRCPVCCVPLPSAQQPDIDSKSRRTIARMKKSDRVIYATSWPDAGKEGMMVDLSPKGMRFICSEELRVGAVLKVTTPLLKACGVVTNRRLEQKKGRPFYSVGVSFIAVDFEKTRGAFFSASA